jgi:thimet oligopeptidase
MFPAGFSHIVQSNYAAGYYGYLWSKVVAADLRTAFAKDKLDAAVGRRYRATVLEQGGQKPPQELVREFLGREFDARAFFDDLRR